MNRLLCILLLSSSAMAQVPKPMEFKTLATPTGRFTFGQISDRARDTFMLDTQTGQLWQLVTSKDEGLQLQQVKYINTGGIVSNVPLNLRAEESKK